MYSESNFEGKNILPSTLTGKNCYVVYVSVRTNSYQKCLSLRRKEFSDSKNKIHAPQPPPHTIIESWGEIASHLEICLWKPETVF